MAELSDLAGRDCQAHGAKIKVSRDGTMALCLAGAGHCETEELLAWAVSLNGALSKPRNIESWKLVLHDQYKHDAKKALAGGALTASVWQDATLEQVVDQLRTYCDRPGLAISQTPPQLSETEVQEELESVAREEMVQFGTPLEADLPATQNGNGYHPPAIVRSCSLEFEDQEQAVANNAEYLSRPPIIERLGYTQSIALMIGGKHHGKTTNVRTLTLSVMRGLPIWGRQTTQGAVLYACSDDEYASTRNELLHMGWSAKSDPLKLARIRSDSDATPAQVLEDLATEAVRLGAVLIILDMLFDFVGIKDELSYAGTREAIGEVQTLADRTKALVVGSHHTPKYLTDMHNAANAALGSQGVSARFSPIILTRKWTDKLYTVESTMTRDPRGLEVKPTRIIKNDQGWIEAQGDFKEWMKWELYADKVMSLFEGGERTAGYSVYDIAEKLDIDRSRAQNTLYQLSKEALPRLVREKRGKGWRYYLGGTDMFEREGGNFNNREVAAE